MAEYIERTRLLEILTDYYNCAAVDDTKPLSVCTAADCLSIVEGWPTADVVEVVRCKDCAIPHNIFTGCPNLNGLIPPENHFCSYGERKEGEDNA